MYRSQSLHLRNLGLILNCVCTFVKVLTSIFPNNFSASHICLYHAIKYPCRSVEAWTNWWLEGVNFIQLWLYYTCHSDASINQDFDGSSYKNGPVISLCSSTMNHDDCKTCFNCVCSSLGLCKNVLVGDMWLFTFGLDLYSRFLVVGFMSR